MLSWFPHYYLFPLFHHLFVYINYHFILQNSVEGELSTSQLRLAYSTLVLSAAMTSTTGVPGDTYTLAWYCVELLIRYLSPLSYTSKKKLVEADNDTMKADDDCIH